MQCYLISVLDGKKWQLQQRHKSIYVSKRINKISFNLKLLTINSASGASKFLSLQKDQAETKDEALHVEMVHCP